MTISIAKARAVWTSQPASALEPFPRTTGSRQRQGSTVIRAFREDALPAAGSLGPSSPLCSLAATVPEEGDARDFAPLRRRQSAFAYRSLQRIDLTLCLRIQPYGEERGLLPLTLGDPPRLSAQRPELGINRIESCPDPGRCHRVSILNCLRKVSRPRPHPRRGADCGGERCPREHAGLRRSPARPDQSSLARSTCQGLSLGQRPGKTACSGFRRRTRNCPGLCCGPGGPDRNSLARLKRERMRFGCERGPTDDRCFTRYPGQILSSSLWSRQSRPKPPCAIGVLTPAILLRVQFRRRLLLYASRAPRPQPWLWSRPCRPKPPCGI